MKRRKNNAFDTLIDLWIGILLYFVLFLLGGILFYKDLFRYTLGLAAGCVTAAVLAGNMYCSFLTAIELGAEDGQKCIRRNGILRKGILIAAVLAGFQLPVFSFPAVMIGIMSLKISAFLQPYVKQRITDSP